MGRISGGCREFGSSSRRRAVDGFRANRALADPSSLAAAFFEGKSQLEVARRRSAVYSLYSPKTKSVMEIKSV